ncbi:MAG: hypothetical protein QM756_45390 [Polyangiaceae bacterium]
MRRTATAQRQSAPAARAPTPGPEPRAETTPEALVFLSERALLAELEASGLSLRALFPDDFEAHGALPRSVRARIRDDLRELTSRDSALGVSVARFSHRLFPEAYLADLPERARFRLVGVATRPDRRVFEAASCGETRLLYRLEYADAAGAYEAGSALPATLIAEFSAQRSERDVDCRAQAARWALDPKLPRAELVRALRAEQGPLSAEALSLGRLKQLALNVQVVRWPAAVRPQLGGHAEYLLRAFAWDAERKTWRPRALENTPDAERIQRDRTLQRELVEFLNQPEQVSASERGTLLLPEKFLAFKAISVSPRGLSRKANRPFSRSLEASSVKAGAELSARARLRRLDQLSCPGCHQARSVAGFHFLGEDAAEAPVGTALVSPFSPHLESELIRRKAWLRALAEGRAPAERVPFTDEGREAAGFGEACGLGDASFARWTCAPGLACRALDAPSDERTGVGACLPAAGAVGAPCQVGELSQTDDAHRDRVLRPESLGCPDAQVCNENAVGFPGGMCTAACGSADADVRCGPIALLEPFNACLARKEPFARCLSEHTRQSGLRACDARAPCRDDYACVRTRAASASEPAQGVCVPPYFVFQLRVDGHPELKR